jgi:hypothetical protein
MYLGAPLQGSPIGRPLKVLSQLTPEKTFFLMDAISMVDSDFFVSLFDEATTPINPIIAVMPMERPIMISRSVKPVFF